MQTYTQGFASLMRGCQTLSGGSRDYAKDLTKAAWNFFISSAVPTETRM